MCNWQERMSATFALIDTAIAKAPFTLIAPIALPKALVSVSEADVAEDPGL